MSSQVVWEQNNLSPKVWGKKVPPVSDHLGPKADFLADQLGMHMVSRGFVAESFGLSIEPTATSVTFHGVLWNNIA